jgi:hypothetical protein
MHMPILIMISTLIPNVKNSNVLGIISIVLTLLLVLALAELGERRKRAYAKAISWVFNSKASTS